MVEQRNKKNYIIALGIVIKCVIIALVCVTITV